MAKERAESCKATAVVATKPAESKPSRKSFAKPQWILELEARHSHATAKQLHDIVNEMRKHHQQQMEGIFK